MKKYIFFLLIPLVFSCNAKKKENTPVMPPSIVASQSETYSWYNDIGKITAITGDSHPVLIEAEIKIAYKRGDTLAQQEIASRKIEIKDFIRNYFSNKTSTQLKSQWKETFSLEIRNGLNTNVLTQSKIQRIDFIDLTIQ